MIYRGTITEVYKYDIDVEANRAQEARNKMYVIYTRHDESLDDICVADAYTIRSASFSARKKTKNDRELNETRFFK